LPPYRNEVPRQAEAEIREAYGRARRAQAPNLQFFLFYNNDLSSSNDEGPIVDMSSQTPLAKGIPWACKP
jgi:hypothetical protein